MDIPLCLWNMKKKGNVENYSITTFYNEDYKKDNSLSVGGRVHCSAALTIFLSYLGSHWWWSLFYSRMTRQNQWFETFVKIKILLLHKICSLKII